MLSDPVGNQANLKQFREAQRDFIIRSNLSD
jgi:hypothetical protein